MRYLAIFVAFLFAVPLSAQCEFLDLGDGILIDESAFGLGEKPDAAKLCDRFLDQMSRYCGPDNFNQKLCDKFAGLAIVWCERAERDGK